MRLRTCAAPSANGSHTISCKPKFVGFLREHRENLVCHVSCVYLKPGRHIRTKQFANHSQMVRKPNMCMCGWDCEHTLHHLRMVRIPFTANQNLSKKFVGFSANTERIWCTVSSVFASRLVHAYKPNVCMCG